MSVILDSCFLFIKLILLYFFQISDDHPLPLLEHDELDSLLNGIDWDQPSSPLDLNLPKDPDIITLLSSSFSPISPVVLQYQPPNPLVDKFFQSSTDNPIQFTDSPSVPQHESRANNLLPSIFGSKAHPNNIQSEKSQSNPSSPRGRPFISTALIGPAQDARASLSLDQIDFQPVNTFPYRSGKKVIISITNLFEGPDTTPIYTTS